MRNKCCVSTSQVIYNAKCYEEVSNFLETFSEKDTDLSGVSLACYEEVSGKLRTCYEAVNRKLLPWNLSLTAFIKI